MAAPRVYIDMETYRDLSVIPDGRIDEMRDVRDTFFLRNFEVFSRRIETRLRHKYTIPFPENDATIQGWIVALVDLRAVLRIGIDPSDPTFAEVQRVAAETEAQLNEAADLQSSRFNLPLRGSEDKSAISKGGPFGYSEASPYAWTDDQWTEANGG